MAEVEIEQVDEAASYDMYSACSEDSNLKEKLTIYEELKLLKSEVDCAYREYMKQKLVRSAIKKSVFEGFQYPEIAQKAQQIITAQTIASVGELGITKSGEPLMILGLDEDHKSTSLVELSYTDKLSIASLVNDNLEKSCSSIKTTEETENEILSHKNILEYITPSDNFKLMTNAKLQYEELCENLAAIRDLMKEISAIRLDYLHKMKTETVPWLEAKCENLELEARTLEMQLLIHMMRENSHIVDAIKQVEEYSLKMYAEKKEELEKLKSDAKAYKELEGTKYDEVLKKYKHYKKELEMKEWILVELSEK